MGILIVMGIVLSGPFLMWAFTGKSIAQQWRESDERVRAEDAKVVRVKVTEPVKVKRRVL